MVRFSHVKAIAKKNLLALLHDKRTFGLLLGMPIFLMLLFGYAFGQQVNHVPIKIVNLDQGGSGVPLLGVTDTQYSDIGINFLIDDERVDVTLLDTSTFNLDDETSKIYGGHNYYALVVFHDNFSEEIPYMYYHINISVYLDDSDLQTIASVQTALSEMVGVVLNSLSPGGQPHLALDVYYVAGDPDLRPIDTMAPGILSFAVFLFMILTVTGGFTKERLTGTLYRVVATSTTKSELVLGYLLGNSLVALVQSVLLLAVGVLIFNLNVVGNLALLFFILFIYALSCVGIGIFASVFAHTELQAFQFVPLLLIPSMFFSGFLFPLNSFPLIFQYISYIIPMTYSIRMSRAIMINGLAIYKVGHS